MATLAELLTSKIPPQNLPAERAVLGACLVDPAAPALVLDALTADDFYLERHRTLYTAMATLGRPGQVVDLLTLSDALRPGGQIEAIGGPAYLGQLIEEAALLTATAAYCQMVREAATLRAVIRVGTDLVGRAYDNGGPPAEILAQATQDVEALARRAGPRAPDPFAEGAGDLLARAFPPVDVLIEGILTSEGSGFIGGEEKLGKTYYALVEAFSLAMGIPLCGRFAVPARQRVLFIEEEDSPRRTRLRLRAIARGAGVDPDGPAFQAELSAWLRSAVWTGFRLDDPAWIARLGAELRAFPATVVYLDVLRKLTAKDLTKQVEMSPIFDGLDTLRRTFGCLFRVLHHFRKSQGVRMGRGSQELGGSFVLGAWAEQSVYLEPIGRKGAGTSFDVQCKDAAAPLTLRLRFEVLGPAQEPDEVRLWLDDVRPDQAPGEKHADLVLTLLETLPHEPGPAGSGVTIRALVEASKLSRPTVARTLTFLAEKGLCCSNESRSTKARRYTPRPLESEHHEQQIEKQGNLL